VIGDGRAGVALPCGGSVLNPGQPLAVWRRRGTVRQSVRRAHGGGCSV